MVVIANHVLGAVIRCGFVRKSRRILCLSFLLTSVVAAQGQVFNFDDIPTGAAAVLLNPHYAPDATTPDLTWSDSWYVMASVGYDYYKNLYYPPSLPNAVYNYGGAQEVSLVSKFRFDLDQVEFATLAMNNAVASLSSRSVTLEGYRDGKLVGEMKVELVTSRNEPAGFVKVQPKFHAIDTFIVRNDGVADHYWLMDNMAITPVPEPAEVAVATGLGLAALAVLRTGRRGLASA